MSRRLEIGALLALCFFLPLYEAPKSIFLVLYLIIWAVNRARARDWGGPWDLWDSLFAAWIASGFVVAAFAGLQGSEWRGPLDLLRYGSVAWVARRGRYDAREMKLALGTLVASALAGLAWGYANLWRGASNWLNLNSVGHVNHTAIYLAIMLTLAWSWTFAGWKGWSAWRRLAALAVNALFIFSLVVTTSRSALGAGVGAMILIAALWRGKGGRPRAAMLAMVAVAVLGVLAHSAPFVEKYERAVHASDPLGSRHAIWRAAFAAWQRYPWFGVGMDNFSQISLERLGQWRREAGRDFDARLYDISPYRFSHGHSLYFTALAERGIVGLVPLVALLLAWLVAVARRPRPEDGDDHWLAWGGALGAWFVTAGVGVVNTTLHHEHGILAALLLGLWLSKRAGR